MKIIFYGGKQAGATSLLTLLALRHKILCVIPQDDIVESVARGFGLVIKPTKNINEKKFVSYLKSLKADLFICCHGKQIIKRDVFHLFPAINVHPCLYKYPGAKPIKRLINDKNNKASVAVHVMTEDIDEGEVIVERFQDIQGNSEEKIYNELYPLYSSTLIRALTKIL